LAGVRVIQHKETPGLGDKIMPNKADWILQFEGLSLQNPTESRWKVKKDGGDFDQFTGATITPRAVVTAVKKALIYFENNRDQLFMTTPNKETNK
jgi:electron transport complex protein RnfG